MKQDDPNLPPEVEAQIRGKSKAALIDIKVWPENWQAVEVFRRCQWQRSVDHGREFMTHIDATEIHQIATAVDVPFTADLVDRVRVMENEARKHLNAA